MSSKIASFVGKDITNKLWYCPKCFLYWSEFYPLDVGMDDPTRLSMPSVPYHVCKHCQKTTQSKENICYRCKRGEHGRCASDFCTCCGDPLKNGKDTHQSKEES
jgi:hypothetical protein